MKKLWLLTVGLGLVFVAVWAAGKAPSGPEPDAAATRPPVSESTRLAEQAKGDAIGRSPSGATIQTETITPKLFRGPTLQDNPLAAGEAHPGFTVVLDAMVGGKPVSKLTYHVAPPDLIVFVKQQTVK